MNNWENVLIDSSSLVKEAIATLSSGGMRIVLVVDKKNKLLGTITDGDIRRALLKKISTDELAINIMNSSPKTAFAYQDRQELLTLMQNEDILHIPIVDDSNQVIGLETFQNFVRNKKLDNVVFIMAGGFGSRLRSLTKNTPKPLLKVGNQPILETIIQKFIACGFQNFYISIHYKAQMIKDYFGNGSLWGVNIEYIVEDTPLGTAGSLSLLPANLPNLPMIVMNGDLLTRIDFNFLLDFHHQKPGNSTLCVREYNHQVPYGVIEIEGQYVKSLNEKPVNKYFVNAGIYVIDRPLVKKLKQKSFLDMPELFETFIEDGEKVNVFPIHEYWLDIGRIEEFERANREINIL